MRLSGKFVPFAASTVVLAMLPFLGGSAPAQQGGASVVLAAGDRQAVDDAVQGVDAARATLAGADSTVAAIAAAALAGGSTGGAGVTGMAVSTAVGGGFVFPGLSLPAATDAAVLPAVLPGQPGFIHPVPGIEVSAFGPRIHPLLGRPMFHTGIDLSASCGTPIRAAASGTVVYARQSDSWGLRTIIQHTPTLKTAYGHQTQFLVKEGDTVTQGQVIGLVGTTGWSTGCHLHFDVIVDDRYVDPAPYLGFAASGAPSAGFGPSYSGGTTGGYPRGGTVATSVPQTAPDGDVDFTQVQPADPAPRPSSTSSAPSPTSTATPKPTSSTPSTTRPTTSSPSPSSTTTKPTTTGTPTPSTTTSTSTSTSTSTPSTTTSTPTSTSAPSTTTSSPSPSSPTSTSSPSSTSESPAPPVVEAPSTEPTTKTPSDPSTSAGTGSAAPAEGSDPTPTATTTGEPTGTPTP